MATEVELRGPLTEAQASGLLEHFVEHAVTLSVEDRFLVDYSTLIEGIGERVLDVRIRSTNRQPELVVKKGQFGGTSRTEAAARVLPGDFDGLVLAMALLGYGKGVAADRGIRRFKDGGIEFAIQDVRIYGEPGRIHSRFFEAEILLTDDSGVEQAEKQLRQSLADLGLTTFSVEEWNEYVATMNREANGLFDIDDAASRAEAVRIVQSQRLE